MTRQLLSISYFAIIHLAVAAASSEAGVITRLEIQLNLSADSDLNRTFLLEHTRAEFLVQIGRQTYAKLQIQNVEPIGGQDDVGIGASQFTNWSAITNTEIPLRLNRAIPEKELGEVRITLLVRRTSGDPDVDLRGTVLTPAISGFAIDEVETDFPTIRLTLEPSDTKGVWGASTVTPASD